MNELRTARYLSLATWRRDGRRVATPVWAAPLDDLLVVFSAGNAGKVKRLRNSDQAEIAVCDVRGKRLGPGYATRAWLMDNPARIDLAHGALLEKYGWQMKLADLLSRVSGRINQRAWIAIELPRRA